MAVVDMQLLLKTCVPQTASETQRQLIRGKILSLTMNCSWSDQHILHFTSSLAGCAVETAALKLKFTYALIRFQGFILCELGR